MCLYTCVTVLSMVLVEFVCGYKFPDTFSIRAHQISKAEK